MEGRIVLEPFQLSGFIGFLNRVLRCSSRRSEVCDRSAAGMTLPGCSDIDTLPWNCFRLTAHLQQSKTVLMGLDGVEIVMEVEDAFDITIEDNEAEKTMTPRQLIDLVMSKMETTTTDRCLTHRSFNLVRTFIVRRCALERRQVKPDTKLQIAIPRVERRARLQQLSADLAIAAPPELARPEWLRSFLCLFPIIAGLAVLFCFARSGLPSWIPALLAVVATGYIGAAATRSCCTEFPKELVTVGELARWIMTHKPDLAVTNATSWTRDQVAARVREIVINKLSCESVYREDARFIEDLGLN